MATDNPPTNKRGRGGGGEQRRRAKPPSFGHHMILAPCLFGLSTGYGVLHGFIRTKKKRWGGGIHKVVRSKYKEQYKGDSHNCRGSG